MPLPASDTILVTGIYPIAAGSDSLFCGNSLLVRGEDYRLNTRTGAIHLLRAFPCDSLRIRVYQLPAWLSGSSGNPAPRGRRIVSVPTSLVQPEVTRTRRATRVELSGNKSFSLAVGRSGESNFSQGLNLDFEAELDNDLKIRGSVSDRIGSIGETVSGFGGTTILSELDKYFFEIKGRRVLARGGDIESSSSAVLPSKRIKGVFGSLDFESLDFAADIGRPSGRFVLKKFRGVDGKQGPYQLTDGQGRPTGVVPGSETIYVDGRRLDKGSDNHYEIDYPSGRVTFSPRILITSRSRIEADFEASQNDYEQVVYDAAGDAVFLDRALRINAGFRRETDDKDRLRFIALSPEDISLLAAAGDSSVSKSGVIPRAGGPYEQAADSAGDIFYRFVGEGNGAYDVSFSFVGSGAGGYDYLGGDEYHFVGKNQGAYDPVIFLPSPSRNDFFYSGLDLSVDSALSVQLSYEGNIRDENLFSKLNDGNNFRSQFIGLAKYRTGFWTGSGRVRLRQQGYDPLKRRSSPDNRRHWGRPEGTIPGDQWRYDLDNALHGRWGDIRTQFGYMTYADYLNSYRYIISGRLLEDAVFSPSFLYHQGHTDLNNAANKDGRYRLWNVSASVQLIKKFRWQAGFERESYYDRISVATFGERHRAFTATAFYRTSVLSYTRRMDYQGIDPELLGPVQDRISLTGQERIHRLRLTYGWTWLEQRALDSDRGDRSDRLYQASARYTTPSGWLSFSADYRQNLRTARAQGYRYIKVDAGEGDYRLEEGDYLPDPNGDYIRITEELGGEQSVSVGEKAHNIVLYPGRWQLFKKAEAVLSQIAFRLRTDIYEEVPGTGSRNAAWLLPWYSNNTTLYLQRRVREGYSILLFPRRNFYHLTMSLQRSREERSGVSNLRTDEKEYLVEARAELSPALRASLSWRPSQRKESGSGISSIDISQQELSVRFVYAEGIIQVVPRITVGKFDDAISSGEGRFVTFAVETAYRRSGRGEVRTTLGVNSIQEEKEFSQPEFLVTNGNRFGTSIDMGVNANYDLGGAMRIHLTVKHRIFEDRQSEFSGRGELVASF